MFANKAGLFFILLGVVLIIVDVLFHPFLLPRVVDMETSEYISYLGYTFYFILLISFISIFFGFNRIISHNSPPNIFSNVSITSTGEMNNANKLFEDMKSFDIFKLVISDVINKKILLVAALSYAIFYCFTSGIIIYRAEGLPFVDLANIPSLIMMSFGPTGYAPTLSVTLTETIGLLFIPYNLILAVSVSFLVGINIVMTISALRMIRLRKSSLMSIIGASAGLFVGCPTCASIYILGFFFGSFAHTMAIVTTSFYGLFLLFSIPMLVISPVITIKSIKKSSSIVCSIEK